MSSIRVNTTQNIQLEFELATLGDRILAFLLDWVVIIAYVFLIFIIFFNLFKEATWAVILLFLPALFYYLILETFLNGQTIGKRA
ncbi:MAG: RDD family protein, partial [Chitinophagaceae bacterium]